MLDNEGPLSLERALPILVKLCAGLDAMHAQGIVHRDIKPDNVFLIERNGDRDFVKVVDLGVAKKPALTRTTTLDGRVVGTADYISPEAALGHETDERSDVYSVAVLSYRVLCGELPFSAPNVTSVLLKHVNEEAPDIRTRFEGTRVPEALAAVVMRALSKEPEERYPTIAAYAQALLDAAQKAALPVDRKALLTATMWSTPKTAQTPALASQPVTSKPPSPAEIKFLSTAPNPFDDDDSLVETTTSILPRSKARNMMIALLCFALAGLALFWFGWNTAMEEPAPLRAAQESEVSKPATAFPELQPFDKETDAQGVSEVAASVPESAPESVVVEQPVPPSETSVQETAVKAEPVQPALITKTSPPSSPPKATKPKAGAPKAKPVAKPKPAATPKKVAKKRPKPAAPKPPQATSPKPAAPNPPKAAAPKPAAPIEPEVPKAPAEDDIEFDDEGIDWAIPEDL